MAWKDPRSSVRTVAVGARTTAHADDAKRRVDESSQVARRRLPRKLVVSVVAVLLLLATVAVVAATSGDHGNRETPTAAEPGTSPSPSEVDDEPSPAEVLETSAPSGRWRAQVIGRQRVLRDGTRSPLDSREKATRWTFTDQTCTDQRCTGTVSSTTGDDFRYVWNGRSLVVERGVLTSADPKVACRDENTGEIVDISQGAAKDSFTYTFGPFTGSPERWTSRLRIAVKTEFFGSCRATPKDTVAFLEEQVLTPMDES